jgi:hypothetical protein
MIETLEVTREDLTRGDVRARAIDALERGWVVYLPRVPFELTAGEKRLADPAQPLVLRGETPRASGRPTVFIDQSVGKLRGATLEGDAPQRIVAMLDRYADWCRELVLDLFPGYGPALEQEYTTFRPFPRTEVQGLHVDATIGRPMQGRCMLRVFANINAAGVPRGWHVGEEFEPLARRYVDRIRGRIRDRAPGLGWLVKRLGISKHRPAPYDFAMRELRSLMKGDVEYQATVQRTVIDFPTGATWLAFTDKVSHGALSGQHSLDQCFIVDYQGLRDPDRSTLRILERLTGRPLV